MPKSNSDKTCEKCGQSFTCNANDISKCFCTRFQLTADVKKTLAEKYADCLCSACLAESIYQK